MRLKTIVIRRSVWISIVFAMVCAANNGCQVAPKTFTVERPDVHKLKTDSFEIRSNFPIAEDSPLARELHALRLNIQETLQLPEQRDPVIVYLFSDEESYRRYMRTTWPTLPARRAYFVGTSRELAVYSYHSQFVEEDLRHEFTHGLLHASLNTVPLWLDEGLAEYFEVRGSEPGLPHTGHVQFLQAARADGWTPSLYQLEQLSDFQKMTQRDYAEAWGWVHFMLHDNPAGKQTLLSYVDELETKSIAPALMPRLEKAAPSYYNGMTTHVAGMASGISTVNFEQ